jgi:hypothetical protein
MAADAGAGETTAVSPRRGSVPTAPRNAKHRGSRRHERNGHHGRPAHA